MQVSSEDPLLASCSQQKEEENYMQVLLVHVQYKQVNQKKPTIHTIIGCKRQCLGFGLNCRNPSLWFLSS